MANEQPHFQQYHFSHNLKNGATISPSPIIAYHNNMSVTVPPTVGIDNIFHNFVAKVKIQTQVIKE
jgi:hypothetical protein